MIPLFEGVSTPIIFGHRGYSSLAAENTMEAFDLCREKGVVGIEFDVHLCRSGELVIIHDHDLKRVANTEGIVEEFTFSQLQQLDVGSHKGPQFANAKIPLLQELFERHKEYFIYDIELKVESIRDTTLAAKTWALIKEYRLENRCIVSSFNPFVLAHFNRVSKRKIPTATLFAVDPLVPKFLQHGWGRHIAQATLLKPEWAQMGEKHVNRFQKMGYPLITWTVDDLKMAQSFVNMGVVGLISNNPEPLIGIEKSE